MLVLIDLLLQHIFKIHISILMFYCSYTTTNIIATLKKLSQHEEMVQQHGKTSLFIQKNFGQHTKMHLQHFAMLMEHYN